VGVVSGRQQTDVEGQGGAGLDQPASTDHQLHRYNQTDRRTDTLRDPNSYPNPVT